MSGRLVCACLALVAAFVAGTLSDKQPGPTGLGGPAGWRSFAAFMAASALVWGAVR